MDIEDITAEAVFGVLQKAGHALSITEVLKTLDADPSAKVVVRQVLKTLARDGRISAQGGGKLFRIVDKRTSTPEIAAVSVLSISMDGEAIGQQLSRDGSTFGAEIILKGDDDKSFKAGDHVLARLRVAKDGTLIGRVFKIIGRFKSRVVLGRATKTKSGLFRLVPVNRKVKDEFDLEIPKGMDPPSDGDLVEGLAVQGRQLRRPTARLHALVGRMDDPKAISLISIHEQGLRVEFGEPVLAEAAPMDVPPLGRRNDLRDIPLVTIDGADARDFDDAVYATALPEGGFRLVVAIADVAHYVRHESHLDSEAYKRGNSAYFPDRVVPMLPEKLSNDLCSLRPDGDRACLAMDMRIDSEGNLQSAHVMRGLMRSRARLTYDQVQAAMDGTTDALTDPLMDTVIRPLYAAYAVLKKAREIRGALDLDRPERQVVVDESGKMTGVRLRSRYDSHRLIEEFMILANVAAAQLLEAKQSPCMYRIHDKPNTDKVDAARQMLDGFGVGLPPGIINNTKPFNHVLARVAGQDFAPIVSEIVLRSQSQAVYAPKNIGHFGLALKRYAHFTSPIRRYADLLVHRALIGAYDLGDDGLTQPEIQRFEEIAEHISTCERTAMEAERAAVDRFTASFLESHIGESYSGRISGVTRFGLFITLDSVGADGLVPMRLLPPDTYWHDERQHALIGRRSGRLFRLCAPVEVRILSAERLTGTTTFELIGAENGADVPGFQAKKGKTYKKNLTRPPKSGKSPASRFKSRK